MMRTNQIKNICAGVEIEQVNRRLKGLPKKVKESQKYIGFIEEKMNEKPFSTDNQYKYMIHLQDEPVSLSSWKNLDPNIRITRGIYTIQYVPATDKRRLKNFPYVIGQDIVRLRVTVSGPKHWSIIADKIPELKWIKRNTFLCNEYFEIAKRHPGIPIFFSIDFPRYCEMIVKKAESQGIDIKGSPLVTHIWSETFKEEHKDYEICPVKTKADYLAEIEDAKNGIKTEE